MHRHPVWSRGYTQLFFLDEVTALAAGHRLCAECRRADALAFAAAVARQAGIARPLLRELDVRLHGERLDGRRQRRYPGAGPALPDGAMVADHGRALAIRGCSALPWSPDGYGSPEPRPRGKVEVLTPPTMLAALAAGYRPGWHASAG